MVRLTLRGKPAQSRPLEVREAGHAQDGEHFLLLSHLAGLGRRLGCPSPTQILTSAQTAIRVIIPAIDRHWAAEATFIETQFCNRKHLPLQ